MASLQELQAELIASIRSNNPSPVLYDLGCGQSPAPGFTGVDLYAEDAVRADLYTYPWPFADGSVDYFRASHFLEHVPDFAAHFREIYRCLKVGGYYEIISPYYLNNRWFQDPDHKCPILHERFFYLNAGWRKAQKQNHRGDLAEVNFDLAGTFELLNDDFRDSGLDAETIAWHKRHSWNVIDDVAFVLRKEQL